MSERMLSEQQIRFVEKPRIGRLGTTMRNGSPHVAPIWYRFDEGAFLILTERGSQKHKNVEHDDRVTLCIDDERPPYHTVIVRGRAAVEEAPGREWREVMAIHYLGEDAGRRYVAESDNPNNIMLRIVLDSVVAW